MIHLASLWLLLLILPAAVVGQCPADSSKLDDASADIIFRPIAKTLFNEYHPAPPPTGHPVDENSLADTIHLTYVPFLESWAVTRANSTLASRLADLELSRWSKETSSGSGASGKTSVTSQGSVASLFSFAVENGALTRSVSGTTVTFRTSPANVIAALQKGGWWAAGTSVPNFDGSFESIAKRASFFVSFDTSRGNSVNGSTTSAAGSSGSVFTGDPQQLSGWGARYELINHRDPRDLRYRRGFRDLMRNQGKALADAIKGLALQSEFKDKVDEVTNQLAKDVATHKDDENAILDDYKKADQQARAMFCSLADSSPATYRSLNEATDVEVTFLLKEADIFNQIARTWTLALEYNVTKQANTNGTLPVSITPGSSTNTSLPDLGNFNVVASHGFSDGPQLTANASFTWFQNLPAGSKSGHIRDARVTGQFDVPLKEIKSIGKPTMSISGLFLALLEQPIGQQVLVNDVPVSLTGNIGLVQGKLTIPTKSAISIPLSVTWASRTELVKESDVRGNFGISFDLDKLFAKGETKQ